jgi:hypothetical protein
MEAGFVVGVAEIKMANSSTVCFRLIQVAGIAVDF